MTYDNKENQEKKVRECIIQRMINAAGLDNKKQLADKLEIEQDKISKFITRHDLSFYKKIIDFADTNNISLDNLLISKRNENYQKGKESQINKFKERKERVEGKLYDIEGLSQERLDKIQEMIDNWKVEDANKRKEERRKRASKSESKKSKSA